MKYDLNFYTSKRAEKRDNYFKDKPLFYNKGVDTNKVFFTYILDYINKIKNRKKTIKILDLGTGTGYVPSVLCSLCKVDFRIIGVDLAKPMIEKARINVNDKRVRFVIEDNKKLPFKRNEFDIITNKLTTRFNFNEVDRLLKRGGSFVFKEYDRYKGFKEIFDLFKKRYNINNTKPEDYYFKLKKLNFREVLLRSFLIKRKYKVSEVNKIFEMANIINNFSNKDAEKIKEFFGKEINITSDPFVIYAEK